ncbi:neurensin-1-like [Argiope bruennichi]|uniref:Neurensin-1 like protein n=2 Tax=Araneidae TaxID=6913 RepID=A0A8T0EUZ6_ARGBR|nr:neurensin-1-like [Argiope bruennichi]KAF8781930.1 Neurensin-1 like protein [Argiope bruennichi]
MQSKDENSSLLGGEAAGPSQEVSIDQSKGARPKIRNPKEAKRQRFVMKQAKTISKPQPLESVSESEEGQALLPKATDFSTPGPSTSTERNHPEFFGVRSYVHTFYEAMAMDNPQDFENEFGYPVPSRKRRRQLMCWRWILGSGVVTLMLGAILIAIGFLVPKRNVVVDIQEDIEIIDKEHMAFNYALDIVKIMGITLFCTGGLMVAGLFLALTFICKSRIDDPLNAEEIPLAGGDACPDTGPNAAMDVKVPATEELTAVQPKRADPEEVVMTNAGLCKIP